MDLGQVELDELRAAPVATLEWYELEMAAQVGLSRQVEAVRSGRPDVDGLSGVLGWNYHVNGAGGELSVAKYLGRYWSGSVNTFKVGGDVGATVHVRTRSECWYGLKLKESDPDDDVFVLVLGRGPVYHLRGWCYPRDVWEYLKANPAERRRWVIDPADRGSPVVCAPQSALRPVRELLATARPPRGLRPPEADGRYRMWANKNGCRACAPLHDEYLARARAAAKPKPGSPPCTPSPSTN